MSSNVSILGNLGRDPETRVNAEGVSITNFSIASNSHRPTPQGAEKKTDWYRVTAIGKQAETLGKYARKGSRLLIQGKLTFNPWIDRGGAPQVSADVLLQDFQFVGESDDTAKNASEIQSEESTIDQAGITDDVQEISAQTH